MFSVNAKRLLLKTATLSLNQRISADLGKDNALVPFECTYDCSFYQLESIHGPF